MTSELLDRYLIAPEQLTSPAVRGILPHGPGDQAALADRLADDDRYDHAALADILRNYNLSIGADDAALTNAGMLANPDAAVVVTGQQAGLFSGPLYTVYKIITAIRLAREWETELARPVVPVFWNATEDHDLSEIAVFHIPGRTWRAEFPDTGLAAEALESQPAVTRVVRDYLDSLGPLDHRAELEALLTPPFINYGLFSSAIVSRLFAGTGLVLLEPRLLRPLAKPYLLQAFDQRQALREALAAGAGLSQSAGVPPAFPVDRGFGLFHIDDDGRRRRLLEKQDQILFEQDWQSPDVVRAAIEASPESFSTAAFLRPVVQSLVLPNLAYVAGPGEWRYHLQLRPVYDHFGATVPILHLRNHATLVTPRESKLIRLLDLKPADLFRGPEPLYHQVELPEEAANAFDRVEKLMLRELEELQYAINEAADPQRVLSLAGRLQRELERLRRKARRDFQRQAGVDNARIDRLFDVVCPGHTPQERRLNVLPFLAQFGPGLIGHLLEHLDPAEPRHYLIRLGE